MDTQGGPDGYSMLGFSATLLGYFFTRATLQEWAFLMTCIAAISTTLYNIIKAYKELKNK